MAGTKLVTLGFVALLVVGLSNAARVARLSSAEGQGEGGGAGGGTEPVPGQGLGVAMGRLAVALVRLDRRIMPGLVPVAAAVVAVVAVAVAVGMALGQGQDLAQVLAVVPEEHGLAVGALTPEVPAVVGAPEEETVTKVLVAMAMALALGAAPARWTVKAIMGHLAILMVAAMVMVEVMAKVVDTVMVEGMGQLMATVNSLKLLHRSAN